MRRQPRFRWLAWFAVGICLGLAILFVLAQLESQRMAQEAAEMFR